MWGGVRVLRFLALLYASWGAWLRRDDMAQPAVAAFVLSILLVWSVLMSVWSRRDLGIHLVELALACAAVYSTRWIDTPAAIYQG